MCGWPIGTVYMMWWCWSGMKGSEDTFEPGMDAEGGIRGLQAAGLQLGCGCPQVCPTAWRGGAALAPQCILQSLPSGGEAWGCGCRASAATSGWWSLCVLISHGAGVWGGVGRVQGLSGKGSLIHPTPIGRASSHLSSFLLY